MERKQRFRVFLYYSTSADPFYTSVFSIHEGSFSANKLLLGTNRVHASSSKVHNNMDILLPLHRYPTYTYNQTFRLITSINLIRLGTDPVLKSFQELHVLKSVLDSQQANLNSFYTISSLENIYLHIFCITYILHVSLISTKKKCTLDVYFSEIFS